MTADGGGVWIGSRDELAEEISWLSCGSTRSRRGGRPRRGASCTAAAAAVAIVLSCAVGAHGECSVNPISESQCSVEMQIIGKDSNGLSTVQPAGQCYGGRLVAPRTNLPSFSLSPLPLSLSLSLSLSLHSLNPNSGI